MWSKGSTESLALSSVHELCLSTGKARQQSDWSARRDSTHAETAVRLCGIQLIVQCVSAEAARAAQSI